MSTVTELTSDDIRALEFAVERRIKEVEFQLTETERNPNASEAKRQSSYNEIHDLNEAMRKVRLMAKSNRS